MIDIIFSIVSCNLYYQKISDRVKFADEFSNEINKYRVLLKKRRPIAVSYGRAKTKIYLSKILESNSNFKIIFKSSLFY